MAAISCQTSNNERVYGPTMGRTQRDIWLMIGIAVGLMSGITSIVREWISIFYPHAVNSGRLFNACLITCFFAAVLFVFHRQAVRSGSSVKLSSRLKIEW
jgi:hypothetical protein